ncbi:MAG: caspase family protein [Hyphomicrobiaceae bacterium]
MLVRIALVLVVLFGGICVLAPKDALAERRVALVIGNSNYAHESRLVSPAQDARDMAASLKRFGFDEVQVHTDLDHRSINAALLAFGRLADSADLALVYYSGHGIEVDGQNYLIPVDARLDRAADVDFEAVNLNRVIAAADRADKVKVIILDACRNNPFRSRMLRQQGKKSVGKGLAPVQVSSGTLVAYAAQIGAEADDGVVGGNSRFTSALLSHIEELDDIRLLLGKVRDRVVRETRSQEPYVYTSLGGDKVVLNRRAPAISTGDASVLARLQQLEELMKRQNAGQPAGTGKSTAPVAAAGRDERREPPPAAGPGRAAAGRSPPAQGGSAAPSPATGAPRGHPGSGAARFAGQAAQARCNLLGADPIESLLFVFGFVGPSEETTHLRNLTSEALDACRAAEIAEPRDAMFKLRRALAEMLFEMFQREHGASDSEFALLGERHLKPLLATGGADASALYATSQLIGLGPGVKRQPARLVEIEKLALDAANKGSPWAGSLMAFIHGVVRGGDSDGVGTIAAWREARRWVERVAADQRTPPGLLAGIGFLLTLPEFHNKAQDPSLAALGIELLRKGAERQSDFARVMLAITHAEGKAVPRNQEEAIRLLRIVGREGGAIGKMVAGVALLKGGLGPATSILPQSVEDGAELLKVAARSDLAPVALFATDMLASARDGLLVSPDEATALYDHVLTLANPHVDFAVAKRFASGAGVPVNLERAMRILAGVAERGDARLALQVANALLKGAGGFPKDVAQGRLLLAKAGEKGNPAVALEVAQQLLDETPQQGATDVANAVRLLRIAAGSSDGRIVLMAAQRLAALGPEHKTEAVKLYRAAAETARGKTVLDIIDMMVKGDLGRVSRSDIARLLRRAAETGDAAVWLIVGEAFGAGTNVYVNQIEAVKWLAKAGEQGGPTTVLKVAQHFVEGKLVPRDPGRADRLIAAVSGRVTEPADMSALGFYYVVRNDPASKHKAVEWLGKAADAGQQRALEPLIGLLDKDSLVRNVDEAARRALQLVKARKPSSQADADKLIGAWSEALRDKVQTALGLIGYRNVRSTGGLAKALQDFARK